MRYSVHLMFGDEFAQTLSDLKKYTLKYGEVTTSSYLSAILWNKKDGDLTISSVQTLQSGQSDSFVSGLQDLYQVEILEKSVFKANERNVRIAAFFEDLYHREININQLSDSKHLHLCIYLPLYKQCYCEQALEIIDVISTLKVEYEIDIFGLSADTAFLFTKDKEKDELPLHRIEYAKTTKQVIEQIVKYRQSFSQNIAHLLLMQNFTEENISLDLNNDSFNRIIGEFALLCVECYPKLFSVNITPSPIKSFGLSVLNFDKYYFVQYLLRRTYLYIFDRENVTQKSVDINKVSPISQSKLKEHTHLVSNFYKNEIEPLLMKGRDHNSIISEITPMLDSKIDVLIKDLQSFVSDKNLTLPEKRTTLAQILGMDDELFTGYIYNNDQLTIDDCDSEAINIFVEANNKLLQRIGSVSKNQDEEDLLEKYIVLNTPHRENSNEVYSPLVQLKKLRIKMRESSNYIREKTKELKLLDGQLKNIKESEKRLTKEGFMYQGNTYRLMHDIEEIPLEETYRPINSIPSAHDFRNDFTAIKDQGSQGACTAFALVSIYESILKKNSRKEYDLSEPFVYFNARKNNNASISDTGSSLYGSLLAMTKKGVCLETEFPYSSNNFQTEPSAEAYESGESRLVKKALNVEPKLDDLRSAIAQGYPVAFSLKVYNSFSKGFDSNTGFISRPTNEEIASNEFGYHAMVACGYSDAQKVFIVRNSWGGKFGDKGYCYIPYSYFTDTNLLNIACIIVDISTENTVVNGIQTQVKVSFDVTDANISHAIIQNLVGEEEYELSVRKKEYSKLSAEYIMLVQTLGNNNKRTTLIDGTIERLEQEISDQKTCGNEANDSRIKALDEFDVKTKTVSMILGSIALLIWTVVGVLTYRGEFYDSFSTDMTWTIIGAMGFLTFLFFLYLPYRKKQRRDLDDFWKCNIKDIALRIDKLKKEKDTTKLKMYLAGMVLDRLFKLKNNLQTKYNGLRSFVGNLVIWHNEESEEIAQMDTLTKDPFIPLLSNSVLDKYFEENKEELSKDLYLYEFINGYQVSDDGIRTFKSNMKKAIIDMLFSRLKDFKTYNHISDVTQYAFLDRKYADISKLLPLLDQKSTTFLQKTATAITSEVHKLLLIHTDTQSEDNDLQKIYPTYFQSKPSTENILSPFKIMIVRVKDMNLKDIELMNE